MLLIGEVPKGAVPRILSTPDETNQLNYGEVILSWDCLFVWNEHCIPADDFEPLRHSLDPLCDDALAVLYPDPNQSVGHDLLETLLGSSHPESIAFIQSISHPPPPEIAATPGQINRARRFFFEYSVPILRTLLNFSLAGGFASPRISRVLHAVSYLVPATNSHVVSEAAKQRTLERLLETVQFLIDVMGCTSDGGDLTPLHGEAWKSIICVRMFHAVARRRIMLKMKRRAPAAACPLGALEVDGLPINQEDLAATLASFAVAPFWCLGRFGFSTTDQQRADWMALWRTVGYYSGVEEPILTKHFASYDVGQYFLASVLVDMIPNDLTNAPTPPTLPILEAISHQGLFAGSFKTHCAWSRWLIGDPLSDTIGLPRTHLFTWIIMHLSIFTHNLGIWFGLSYAWLGRPGWNEARIDLTRISLRGVVQVMMGMRKVKFRPRAEEPWMKGYHPEFDELDPMDLAARHAVQRRWILLIAEMLSIMLFTVSVMTVAIGFTIKYARSTSYTRPLAPTPTYENTTFVATPCYGKVSF